MDEPFKIWIDRLRGGHTQKIAEIVDPAFLDVEEADLRFESPVAVQGEAYVSEDQLILRLKAATKAVMPCAICNQITQTEVKIENFYHTQPTEEIPGAIFDFREALREALLIELPQYIECSGGKCPERPAIAPYLRSEKRAEKPTYFPFKDIDH
jgi:uncharacterized metal-binding protein YceD (DUF177 family)